MPTAFQRLHSGVQRQLWEMKWTDLRPIQTHAIEHLLDGGRDCIIASPTASGKTEAAFLPIVSRLADDWQGGVRAMYIGPLKALINDQFGRMEDLCRRLEIPVHKWHGDVGAADRRALLDRPSGILLITPESLEAMFVLRAARLPAIFGRLDFIVIDELHAFLGSVRGAQLQSQMHRLHERCGCDPVRIGLSATLADPDAACRWLRPVGPAARLLAPESAVAEIRLRSRGFWRPPRDPDAVDDAAPTLTEVARAIWLSCHGKTNLVFANSKARIEQLADELKTQAPELGIADEVVVHHGSLAREQREYAEQRLKDDRPCTAVCTNTLELGIDIGDVDCVVQVDAPWSVASLTQRLGRSGRRKGQARTLRGFLQAERTSATTDLWRGLHLDFIQALAITELMLAKRLEPARTDLTHRSTMTQQLLSMLAETGGMAAKPLYWRLSASGAFAPMAGSEFATLLRGLARHELIEQMADGPLVLGLKGQKLVEHFSFFAAFQSANELRVVHDGEQIGQLPESAIPPPDEHFILSGRRWVVRSIDLERREILVAPARGRKPPWFERGSGEVHRIVHEKMRELLCGDTAPAYLDEVAGEILADARKGATSQQQFRPNLQRAAGGSRLFVFAGTRVQRTLELVLLKAQLKPKEQRVGFDSPADADDLRRALDLFAAADDDGGELAAFAEQHTPARLVGDKFDRFLPSEIWRPAFVHDRLDVNGARDLWRGVAPSALAQRSANRPLVEAPRPSEIATLTAPSLPVLASTEAPSSPARPVIEPPPVSPFDVWLGMGLDGKHLLPVHDLVPGASRLGALVRGPAGFLRDLELRLGLTPALLSHGVRVARYGARLARLAPHGRFYSESHVLDAWGTTEELLRWRDLLVDAGWMGAPVEGAGERLQQLAELEQLGPATEIAGTRDRLREVASELRSRTRLYDTLHLVDPRHLFSAGWRAVFDALEACGTTVVEENPPSAQASDDGDLGRLRRHLAQGGAALPPRGDGTLWLLRAETAWEAAHAAAALLASEPTSEVAVIRAGDAQPLEHALASAGLAKQGLASRHRLRPILQVVSLALELAFEPKDPKRVLELLALPDGPFRGLERTLFSDALCQMPGLGNEEWDGAKQQLADRIRARAAERDETSGEDIEQEIAQRLERIHVWIETPGAPAAGAERGQLLAVVQRVQRWLQGRLAWLDKQTANADTRQLGIERLSMALGHAGALGNALAADSRATLTLLQARQLAEATLGGGAAIDLHEEQAGRLDHVDAPANLLTPRDTVLWWNCIAEAAEQPPKLPFDRREVDALARVGIQLPDRRQLVTQLAAGWRRALTMARGRLILVAPRFVREQETAPHPIWDELCARLGGDRQALARITLESSALRSGTWPAERPVAVELRSPLPLPAPRPEWRVHHRVLAQPTRLSTTSLESLVGCPLRFVLDKKARLRDGSLASLPEGALLNGTLGHRLVERLHAERAFSLDADALQARAEAVLAELLPREAASLLLPGQRTELTQVRRQLVQSMARLADLLRRSQLEIVEVEKNEMAVWLDADLVGRLDVLLVDRQQRDVVLDLKWGRSSYERLLADGCAVQLAAYAWLRRRASGADRFPAVAYFSLSRGAALATDDRTFVGARVVEGADATSTWTQLERTVALVERTLADGRVPVSGVAGSQPTPQACGAAPDDRRHLPLAADAACGYCAHDVVCGRRWEHAQ